MANVWRAWLRAIHRDIGYFAIGFTVIYAVSGIAQNHIGDWGDVSYKASERTFAIDPIGDDVPDGVAIKRVADAAKLGTPTSSLRAGDEIRLGYADNSQVTAIGTQVTVQSRERRAFIGLANWLHKARGKTAWKYVADLYALCLLYLACSGIFMIKGRNGFRWRGAIVIGVGIAVPVLYVAIAGGPGRQATQDPDVVVASPAPASAGSAALPSGIKPLPPDE
ncbi:MAG TPA: PepSY-associated TM helix domain-containing protein [Kofleriaceae bacterium]|jgi:hypothetical protein|nr:PepSY-associated TM helix domain-containing protein [Kofleriaceae bacterium]